MGETGPRVRRDSHGETWARLDPASPVADVCPEVAVKPEPRRWMAAPAFSGGRWQAGPVVQEVSFLQALWILFRAGKRRPIPDMIERLSDIEALIVAGHTEKAVEHLEAFEDRYPREAWRRVGLISLALYDQGREQAARLFHAEALELGVAHPAMTEIFGDRRD